MEFVIHNSTIAEHFEIDDSGVFRFHVCSETTLELLKGLVKDLPEEVREKAISLWEDLNLSRSYEIAGDLVIVRSI